MIVIDQEEIIEIASHFSGRIHGRKDVKFRPVRKSRKGCRKHSVLDCGRKRKLRPVPLFFRCEPFDFVDILHDLLFHAVDRCGEQTDLIFVADLIGELFPRGIVFDCKTACFICNFLQRDQQCLSLIERIEHVCEYGEHQCRLNDIDNILNSRFGECVHLPLHTEQGLCLTIASLEGSHGSDMMCLRGITHSCENQGFRIRLSLHHQPVFHPVFLIGRLLDISDFIGEIRAVVIDRGKNIFDMPVIRLVRPDDINKGRFGSVAQSVQPVPGLLISFRFPSALQISIQLIRIDIILRRGSDPETTPGIHPQEYLRKPPVTDDTYSHSENKEKECISQKTFKSNTADFQFAHLSSYFFFLLLLFSLIAGSPL